MNELAKTAHARGVFIIYAPSSVFPFYKDTPQRWRAVKAPRARSPVPLSTAERWGDHLVLAGSGARGRFAH